MSVVPMTLTNAIVALGKAVPLLGDWTVQGGLVALGATEGPISESGGWTINALTAPEHTGGVEHQATAVPGPISVTIPVIVGDPNLWAKISPLGVSYGVPDNPPGVVTAGLWLVPLSAWDTTATIAYNGSVWAPTGSPTLVQNAIFFPRGYVTNGDISHPFDGGGKSIVSVTYHPMFYGAGPAGKRVWVRGDPVAAGYSTFRA